MYRVVKRDGRIVDFEISKIANAMKKAFDATETNYNQSVIDFLAVMVTADFQPKITDELIHIEDIQDSVEERPHPARGYADVAKAYILYRKQREKLRDMKSHHARLQEDGEQLSQDQRLARQGKLHRHLLRRRPHPLQLRRDHRQLLAFARSTTRRSPTPTATAIFTCTICPCSPATAPAGLSSSSSRRALAAFPARSPPRPASHLATLCNQMVNFLGIMQNEWAGAQAFSSFDTYLAPFVRVDKLSYEGSQAVHPVVHLTA